MIYNTLIKGLYFEYVDFFYLQDCVSNDYRSVDFWIGSGEFDKNPLPKTVEEYLQWIAKQLEFVAKRNERIEKSFENVR